MRKMKLMIPLVLQMGLRAFIKLQAVPPTMPLEALWISSKPTYSISDGIDGDTGKMWNS